MCANHREALSKEWGPTMGEPHFSKIAIMQLFHELKQQFPTTPDHVVSQCIVQHLYDKKKCELTLREAQKSRSPGAFPPLAPVAVLLPSKMQQNAVLSKQGTYYQPHEPGSLDFENEIAQNLVPSTFPSLTSQNFPEKLSDQPTGFELNVNVACNPFNDSDFCTRATSDAVKCSSDIVESRRLSTVPSKYAEQSDYARSFTSVNFTLRPPSSESQSPVAIRSQGSSVTYSSSSLDPRGFQSSLQISIGSNSAGSVSAARIRPNSLVVLSQNMGQRPPGLPTYNQYLKPMKALSAPTTPSKAMKNSCSLSTSLPTTPVSDTNTSDIDGNNENIEHNFLLDQVTEAQQELIEKQLHRKNKLAQALQSEKDKLQKMKRELSDLTNPEINPEEIKRKLKSEIYQLRLKCEILANKIQNNDQRVPLGETREEFYHGIYTGQRLTPVTTRAPPLPLQPPAWQIPNTGNPSMDDREDRFEPPWVCSMCTFANHPLIIVCEQCNMPRVCCNDTPGETQDIHIRVTHHHNFPPRRTVHSWVV